MMVEIACLYTNCECPSLRKSTQKLSKDVTTPVSFTPLIKKIVSEIFCLRTVFRNRSCKFCERSAMRRFFLYCRPSTWPVGMIEISLLTRSEVPPPPHVCIECYQITVFSATSKNASLIFCAVRPGWPLPMVFPSISTTGKHMLVAAVMNTSRAAIISSNVNASS